MKQSAKIYPLFLLGIMLFFLESCGPPKAERSELFTKLYGDESGDFRGVNLGEPLEKVKEAETGSPKTTDRFGYVYKINLGEEKYAMLEYMSREGENRIVNAIVANVFLNDEGETSDIYRESEEFLRGRHGVPDGNFGSYRWSDGEKEMEISLRLLDDKKSFSLNFAPRAGF